MTIPVPIVAHLNAFACRSCGGRQTSLVLSLGKTPLANSLLTADQLNEIEPRYPLDLAFCHDCFLVQITETVPPEILFRDYVYFSSFSDTVLENARSITQRMIADLKLNASSLAIEVASNDGYLLQHYVQMGVPVLGIEPARNIAKVATERGIPTVCEFFGDTLGQQLAAQGQRADVLHANNVFAHVADTNGFVEGIRHVLKPSGVAVIEAPYLKDTIDHTEFDQIYHEHLCYFSLTAVDGLMRRHGLFVWDVEHLPIHGGTLRYFVRLLSSGIVARPSVAQLINEEAQWGVNRLEFYRGFGRKVEQLRQGLLDLLHQLKANGKRIAVYGASAKGSTLMNYFGIGADLLEYVVDRSVAKQGKFTPGTHLPIYSPVHLLEDMPDYVLNLSWNFTDEILRQQADYRDRGGKFIVPIPQLRVL